MRATATLLLLLAILLTACGGGGGSPAPAAPDFTSIDRNLSLLSGEWILTSGNIQLIDDVGNFVEEDFFNRYLIFALDGRFLFDWDGQFHAGAWGDRGDGTIWVIPDTPELIEVTNHVVSFSFNDANIVWVDTYDVVITGTLIHARRSQLYAKAVDY